MKATHHITCNGPILYDLKPTMIDIHEDYVQINCTTVDIKTLERLLLAHKQHFPSEKVIHYQSGDWQPIGAK